MELTMQVRDFLGSVPFFSETLSAAHLEALGKSARVVELGPGLPLIREDDRTESMFVITAGEVAVSIREAGKQREVATLGRGEIVGEIALLTGHRRSATVSAKTPVTALQIDRDAIGPLLVEEPALFDRFAETLERRRAELDRIYGPMAHFYGGPQDDLAIVIRTFFGDQKKVARPVADL
jgi:CRP-like cAMP-binding protein